MDALFDVFDAPTPATTARAAAQGRGSGAGSRSAGQVGVAENVSDRSGLISHDEKWTCMFLFYFLMNRATGTELNIISSDCRA